jgi:CheY-like chemotaxis protein
MIETSVPPCFAGSVIAERRNWAERPLDVLVAEDNKVNQQFATLVLTKAGYHVTIAENGCQAVDAVFCSDFRLVLMDIQMPDLDGIQAIRRIRNLQHPKRSVPIIAMSAHALGGAMKECVAAGADHYISKPFRPATLLSVLTAVLNDRLEDLAFDMVTILNEQPNTCIEDLPVLDLEQLGAFGSAFPIGKIRSLIALYLVDIGARLTLITQYRASEDFDSVSRQAHMIVSTAGNLGAARTSALARILEVSCTLRGGVDIDQQIAALNVSCIMSSCALRQWNFSGASAYGAARHEENFMQYGHSHSDFLLL